MSFDFNVDVKLTSPDGQIQFINMTIGSMPPNVDELGGAWRGASVFVPSSGGDFDWSRSSGLVGVFDGAVADARLVLGMTGFTGPNGAPPSTGASGSGSVSDPDNPNAGTISVRWEVT